MARPAIVAGWVGIGAAIVVVLAFELVLPLQAVVFLLALPLGLLIGWYAGVRQAEVDGGPTRRSGALANGLVAGTMTALAFAALYVAIRLLFLYFDTGFRAGEAALECRSGPDCAYQRALEQPSLRSALDEAGIRNAADYAAFFLEGQALGGAVLIVFVLSGSLVGSFVHAAATPRGGSIPERA